jgi:DNA-binding cell septation regulator SpoVG
VNEVLIIRGVRILEGKKGLFVSMPQEQGKDNKWYDQVVCKSAGIYETLSQTVIEHFQKASQN